MADLRGLIAFATTQYGCVTYKQGLSLLSKSAFMRLVYNGHLKRVHPGVYVMTGFPPSWEQRAHAAVLSVPGSVLSHRSAMQLWGIAYQNNLLIEITIPGTSRVQRTDVLVHESRQLSAWSTEHKNIPVSTVARSLVDMSLHVNSRRLGKLVDEATRRKLVRLTEIDHCLSEMVTKGRSQISRMREVLANRNATDESLDTDLEAKVLEWIRKANLPEPDGQRWYDANGNHYRFDLSYLDTKIDIEPDGPHHRLESVAAYDRMRDADVSLAGWLVIRVQVTLTSDEVIPFLRSAIRQRSSKAS